LTRWLRIVIAALKFLREERGAKSAFVENKHNSVSLRMAWTLEETTAK